MIQGLGLITVLGIGLVPVAPTPDARHDMVFGDLATRWDEAVPLGNGMVGALIWQEEETLRFSLDRMDLWDLRLVDEVQRPDLNFAWVVNQRLQGDYGEVQELLDRPYDREPWPTKIPAGRLEFDQSTFGQVESVNLRLANALCVVRWDTGVVLETFVHATEPVGWFRFRGVQTDIRPRIVPPPFGSEKTVENKGNSLSGKDLRLLGYPSPKLREGKNWTTYEQVGWGGFRFTVVCRWWKTTDGSVEGVWSVISTEASKNPLATAKKTVREAEKRTYGRDVKEHTDWWRGFWWKSAIDIPDPIIETHWYREIYKFGSASRKGAPPISLQAVWTADERMIPPWKGDYHNDLNTQLSYWPAYSGNRLLEAESFVDWLWKCKPAAEKWTRRYFETDGLNFPGVCTLYGEPMGGWVQYSMSPTAGTWLAHHFYLQWQYSQDRTFLEERAYPWLHDTAVFLDGLSTRREDGKRKLPLSSAPEVHDNSREAWFLETTNNDLALIRWLYAAAAEMATELGKIDEAKKWLNILSEWPELARADDDGRLLLAPDTPLHESHRHFNHVMAIHPLGLVDWDNGEDDRQTIRAGLAELERLGPSAWCGYSYSWLANLAARGRDGERAAKALRIFAECFCLINTFHANGDQTKSGKSNFTYRPFTLEGNFAFASGVQEMLMQSHTGTIQLFPAIPEDWRDASFRTLRTVGAFLVSANRKDGVVREVRIRSEKGGRFRLANPFGSEAFDLYGVDAGEVSTTPERIEAELAPGQEVVLKIR